MSGFANTVVVTPERNCPAHRALAMEGVPHDEIHATRSHDYGEWFAALWNMGQPFVVVEHDIIPFPGAIERLWNCPEPRCTHRYPLHQGNVTLGFGIGKYVPQGPAPDSWRETEWRMLDGMVVPVLNERLGLPHVHEPPVAHARAVLAA